MGGQRVSRACGDTYCIQIFEVSLLRIGFFVRRITIRKHDTCDAEDNIRNNRYIIVVY